MIDCLIENYHVLKGSLVLYRQITWYPWQPGDVAGGRFLLEDFRHFFTQQLFGEKEGKDEGTFGRDHSMGPIFGGIKRCNYMVILRDFPALFGLVK